MGPKVGAVSFADVLDAEGMEPWKLARAKCMPGPFVNSPSLTLVECTCRCSRTGRCYLASIKQPRVKNVPASS